VAAPVLKPRRHRAIRPTTSSSSPSNHGTVSRGISTSPDIARTLGSLGLEAASEPAKAGTALTPASQASHAWSPADDHLLISRQEAGMTIQELAILLKRSGGAIRSRLHLLNFKPEKVEEP
jgi:hypothetical protein